MGFPVPRSRRTAWPIARRAAPRRPKSATQNKSKNAAPLSEHRAFTFTGVAPTGRCFAAPTSPKAGLREAFGLAADTEQDQCQARNPRARRGIFRDGHRWIRSEPPVDEARADPMDPPTLERRVLVGWRMASNAACCKSPNKKLRRRAHRRLGL